MKRKSIIENHTQHIRNKLKTNLNEYYEQSAIGSDPYGNWNAERSEKMSQLSAKSGNAVPKGGKLNKGGLIDTIQGIGDIVSGGLSFIPGLNLVGSAIDAVSAGVDVAQGQYGEAGMRAASAGAGIIPGGGAAVKGAKLAGKIVSAGTKAAKGVDAAVDVAKAGTNAVKAAGQATKATRAGTEAVQTTANALRRQQGLSPVSGGISDAIEGSFTVRENYVKVYKTLLEKLNVTSLARTTTTTTPTAIGKPITSGGAIVPRTTGGPLTNPIPANPPPPKNPRKPLKKQKTRQPRKLVASPPPEIRQTTYGTDLIGPQIGQFSPTTQWELQSIGQAERSNPSNANNPMYSRQKFAQISQMGESFNPMKRKIKVAVSSYLKSKHGKKLNDHLKNIRQGLQQE